MKYRATIRLGSGGRQRYLMEDVEADSLEQALRRLLDRFPSGFGAGADLLELRVQIEPESRPQGVG